MNYEKNISISKYKIEYNNSNNKIIQLFPNLTNLNIWADCNLILNLRVKDSPNSLKSIKILTKTHKSNKISKIIKKFKKYGKEIIIELIDKNNEEGLEKGIEEEGEEEEEDEIYNNMEYDEYDEPINNYKNELYSKTSLNGIKGKGKIIEKYDPSHTLTVSRVNNKIDRVFFEKVENSISIFDYSKILKELKKDSKIINKYYHRFRGYIYKHPKYISIKDVKLLYRKSDNKKFKFKDIFQYKELISKKPYIVIMKFSNDLFFYLISKEYEKIYNHSECFFFTSNEIDYYFMTEKELIFNKDECSIGIKDYFMIYNYAQEVVLTKEIKYKEKTFQKNSTFNLLDFELFELIN